MAENKICTLCKTETTFCKSLFYSNGLENHRHTPRLILSMVILLRITLYRMIFVSASNVSSSMPPEVNSSLSIPISKIPDISTKIAASTLRFRLLSLVFALIRQNKGKLFFFTRRPPYPAVLRRSVLLPLSRVRRYSSWYSHPHVPEVPERPLAVRRLRAGYS